MFYHGLNNFPFIIQVFILDYRWRQR